MTTPREPVPDHENGGLTGASGSSRRATAQKRHSRPADPGWHPGILEGGPVGGQVALGVPAGVDGRLGPFARQAGLK